MRAAGLAKSFARRATGVPLLPLLSLALIAVVAARPLEDEQLLRDASGALRQLQQQGPWYLRSPYARERDRERGARVNGFPITAFDLPSDVFSVNRVLPRPSDLAGSTYSEDEVSGQQIVLYDVDVVGTTINLNFAKCTTPTTFAVRDALLWNTHDCRTRARWLVMSVLTCFAPIICAAGVQRRGPRCVWATRAGCLSCLARQRASRPHARPASSTHVPPQPWHSALRAFLYTLAQAQSSVPRSGRRPPSASTTRSACRATRPWTARSTRDSPALSRALMPTCVSSRVASLSVLLAARSPTRSIPCGLLPARTLSPRRTRTPTVPSRFTCMVPRPSLRMTGQ